MGCYRRKFILTALQSLPSDYGKICELYEAEDGNLILIFTTYPANLNASFSLRETIAAFINKRIVSLVATEGGFSSEASGGVIDTILLKSLPDEVKQKVLDGMLGKGLLTAVEYLHVLSKWPFILYGPEGSNEYQEGRRLHIEKMALYDYFINYLAKNQTPLYLFDDKKVSEINQALEEMKTTVTYSAYMEIGELTRIRAQFSRILEKRFLALSEGWKSGQPDIQRMLAMEFAWFLLLLTTDMLCKNMEIYWGADDKMKVEFMSPPSVLTRCSFVLSEQEVEWEEISEAFDELKQWIPFKEYDRLIGLFKSCIRFTGYSKERASKMLHNLLKKMRELGVDTAILVSTPFLAKCISEEMKRSNLSYVLIDTVTSGENNFELYRKMVEGTLEPMD